MSDQYILGARVQVHTSRIDPAFHFYYCATEPQDVIAVLCIPKEIKSELSIRNRKHLHPSIIKQVFAEKSLHLRKRCVQKPLRILNFIKKFRHSQ